MKAQLPKDKLNEAIEEVAKILERRSSTAYEKLQSLVRLFFFAAKAVCLGRAFP